MSRARILIETSEQATKEELLHRINYAFVVITEYRGAEADSATFLILRTHENIVTAVDAIVSTWIDLDEDIGSPRKTKYGSYIFGEQSDYEVEIRATKITPITAHEFQVMSKHMTVYDWPW